MFGFGKKKNGLETEHYPNGQKKSEINYAKGAEHGPIKMWHENGNVALEGEFYFGQQYGVITSWHENGNKSGHVEYDKNGTQIGLSISWYENGNMKARCEMHQGWIHGTYETFHPNGVLSESFQAKYGSKDGESTSYDENGNVIAVERYSDGDLV